MIIKVLNEGDYKMGEFTDVYHAGLFINALLGEAVDEHENRNITVLTRMPEPGDEGDDE